MRFTLAEVESMQVPPEYRSYCMHKIFAWKNCQYENIPFSLYRCHHLKHEYHDCENEEYVGRVFDSRAIIIRAGAFGAMIHILILLSAGIRTG
jgi:hypothetical protein